MSYTKGTKVFVDSNILLYLLDKEKEKKEKAISLLKPDFIISTQVVNENVSVCMKKGFGLSKAEAFSHGKFLLDNFNIAQISASTIESAFVLSQKYNFSFWDSLIVSSALGEGCDTLLSEDMGNGLIVEGKLTIVNPFVS